MERAEQVVDRSTTRADGAPAPRRAATEPAVPHEQALTLAGVSEDRLRLLLVDERGGTFTLAVTSSLRAALRGDASRLGQLEIPMESVLRPDDIQARIRSGETAEQVAQAAQTSVDKIMAFVAPVLAERAHVAERAQRSNVRRSAGETAQGGRTLGEAVESHLRSLNVDPAGVEWDAWRREDGRWTLSAGYALPVRTGAAHFTFDVPGNYVVLDDADARWLVGEVVASPAPGPRRPPVGARAPPDLDPPGRAAARRRRHRARSPTTRRRAAPSRPEPEASPLEAFLDDSPASDDPELRHEAADAAADEPDPEPVGRGPAGRAAYGEKKKGRASVPSWDEIMFGRHLS